MDDGNNFYICTRMVFSRGNIFVRTVLLLVVAMQIAASLPHHHHGGDEKACFVLSHCMDACSGDCCADHEHGCEGECTLKIDVAQFSSEDSYKSFFHCACLANDNFAVVDILPQRMPCVCGLCVQERRDIPLSIDIFVNYQRQAIPVRAPSFL